MSLGRDCTKIRKRREYSGSSRERRWSKGSPVAASFLASWKVWDCRDE